MAIDWSKLLDTAGKIGQVAGAQAGGRAEGRLAESGANMAGANVDLARKKYLNAAPSAFTSQSLVSDLIGNAGDLKLNVPGRAPGTGATGGIRPSTLGAGAKTAAASLGESARARMAQLPSTSFDSGGSYFGHADDLMPQPNAMDKILNAAGTFGQIAGAGKDIAGALGIAGKLGGASTHLVPAAEGGVTTAAGGGGVMGAIGSAAPYIGAGLAIYSAVKAIAANQNATKGSREGFAKSLGHNNLASFNEYLSTLGPAGQAAREYGENVVGKHNDQQNQQWMDMVAKAYQAAGVTPQIQQGGNPFARARAKATQSHFGG